MTGDVPSMITASTRCLEHHLPEDQPSPLGLICPECVARLRRDPPRGPCRGFWESQPILDGGDTCSVFSLAWDSFQIRSLHPSKTLDDLEQMAREVLTSDLIRPLTLRRGRR